MTLTCGTGPPPIVPLPAEHWAVRVEEFHARVMGACAALDKLDANVEMLPSIAAAIEARRTSYLAIYGAEHAAAEHLAAMIRQAEQRAADHEAAVRVALAEGERLPVAGDVALVQKIIQESKVQRDAAYPAVEIAGRAYQAAVTVAAGSRALLLRLQMEPRRLEAEKVMQEVRDVDSRVSIAAGILDAPRLEILFREEGLLR